MKHKYVMKFKFVILSSTVFFFISAVSAALITGVSRETAPMLSNALAAVFWLNVIVGFVFCGILAQRTLPREKVLLRPLLFFRTTPLKIIDSILIVSIIGTILCVIFHSSMTFLWGLLLFLDIAAFEFHILFSLINKEEFSK